jgi:hypothetical protein
VKPTSPSCQAGACWRRRVWLPRTPGNVPDTLSGTGLPQNSAPARRRVTQPLQGRAGFRARSSPANERSAHDLDRLSVIRPTSLGGDGVARVGLASLELAGLLPAWPSAEPCAAAAPPIGGMPEAGSAVGYARPMRARSAAAAVGVLGLVSLVVAGCAGGIEPAPPRPRAPTDHHRTKRQSVHSSERATAGRGADQPAARPSGFPRASPRTARAGAT